jgi:2'-hydroxyisoflavone reductase
VSFLPVVEASSGPFSPWAVWVTGRNVRFWHSSLWLWDLSRTLAATLKYRPLAVTARDTLEFHKSRPEERQQELRAGISAEREAEPLAEWHRS